MRVYGAGVVLPPSELNQREQTPHTPGTPWPLERVKGGDTPKFFFI